MSATPLPARCDVPEITIDDGGLLASLSGLPLFMQGPAFSLVADGTATARLASPTVTTKDRLTLIAGAVGELAVTHSIRLRADGRVIEFGLELVNAGPRAIQITEARAFAARLAPGDWQGLAFACGWGEEFEPLRFGLGQPETFETRQGRSSHGQHPWVGLEATDGRAVAIAPVWSGNWKADLAPATTGTRLAAGLSDFKFCHRLEPGERFVAPAVLVALGPTLEDASVAMSVAMGALVPRSSESEALLTEWNHWWPYTDEEIDEDVFLANAEKAAAVGLDVCVLDAGWFGPSEQSSHWKNLRGDFDTENLARFPSGIAGLADKTRALGVRFGIWIEIEAVGPKAAIRSRRPELLARRDSRMDDDIGRRDRRFAGWEEDDPGFLGYLCFGSSETRRHVIDMVKGVIAKTGCNWIKVDFNIDPGVGCSRTDHDHGPDDGLVAHYRGLYQVLDVLRAEHPDILFEACSSGGLRIDAGLAQHSHCAFLSDPDWTEHHLQVLHGASRLLPPVAMLHFPWSEWRPGAHKDQTLAFDDNMTEDRFDTIQRSGYPHRYGVSYRLPDMAPKWLDRLSRHVAIYRQSVRPFVRNGVLRRLTDMPMRHGRGERVPGFQIDLNDSHLLLGFVLDGGDPGRPLVPRGLDPDAVYRFEPLSIEPHRSELRSGRDWMTGGLAFGGATSIAGIFGRA